MVFINFVVSDFIYMDCLLCIFFIIEMFYNEVVCKFIDMYVVCLCNKVFFMFVVINFYMFIFEEVFDLYDFF